MRQKHQQNLDDVDSMIDNFKQQLGSNILKMTMGELKKHKLYHDIEDTINANMNELNKTLIEKMQLNDDGMNAFNTKFIFFWFYGPHFHSSLAFFTNNAFIIFQ